jgi:hypothetical protein
MCARANTFVEKGGDAYGVRETVFTVEMRRKLMLKCLKQVFRQEGEVVLRKEIQNVNAKNEGGIKSQFGFVCFGLPCGLFGER